MAFTDTGEIFIKESATLPSYMWTRVVKPTFRVLRSGLPKIKNIIPGSGASRALKAGISGITNTGRFIYNRPEVAVPLAVGATIGGIKLVKRVKPALYHVDPAYDITNAGPFGGIHYNKIDNPELLEYIKNKSLTTI